MAPGGYVTIASQQSAWEREIRRNSDRKRRQAGPEDEDQMHASRWDRLRHAECFGLRGMPQDSPAMGSLADLPNLRTRGVLRPVPGAARDQAFSRHSTSHHRRL